MRMLKSSTFEHMDSNKYILSKVKQRIKKIDPEARVILFGSRARDDYHIEDAPIFKQIAKDGVEI